MTLEPHDSEIIKSILNTHLKSNEVQVFVFGSRAIGTARPSSDLDLLLRSNIRIDLTILSNLREAFETSNLPYRVDVILESEISDDFKNKILNELRPLKY